MSYTCPKCAPDRCLCLNNPAQAPACPECGGRINPLTGVCHATHVLEPAPPISAVSNPTPEQLSATHPDYSERPSTPVPDVSTYIPGSGTSERLERELAEAKQDFKDCYADYEDAVTKLIELGAELNAEYEKVHQLHIAITAANEQADALAGALRGCHACYESSVEPHPVHAALAAWAAFREGESE